MSEKKNILVFPCGSEIALDIHSSVCYSTYFHLIGASSVDDHGRFVYEDYVPNIPFVGDEDFLPVMVKLVKERRIDAIYPAMDVAITVLKEHEEELGCRVIASPKETTRICLSKESTYQALDGVVCIPRVYEPQNVKDSDCPVFAKPAVGYGAKGTKRLDSPQEVHDFLLGKNGMLLLEYLPGEEYTVDCFTDKDGRLLYCAARGRNRVKDGISVNTTFVEGQSEFEAMGRRINETLSFRGAWFFQVKRNIVGELCLLEVASRLGGSSLLSRAAGVNLALLSLFDAFDYSVDISPNTYKVELDRALSSRYKLDIEYKRVYCDYDDCLILDGHRVNTELVKFLYECRNKDKAVYLLTKHEGGNLQTELAAFRLDRLFDEVYWIQKDSNKVDYINPVGSIFIDDSHAERMNVQRNLGIPVFSPDMIDVLL